MPFPHSHIFEDDGENKLSYTAIFEEYTSIVESTIEEHLTATVSRTLESETHQTPPSKALKTLSDPAPPSSPSS